MAAGMFQRKATATTMFPVAYSQPFNFLNVDLYAQDTWKLTGKLTWRAQMSGEIWPAACAREPVLTFPPRAQCV